MKFYRIVILIITATLGLNLSLLAQENQNILVTIAGKPVTTDEFLHMYQKNNTGTLTGKQEDLDTYLQRFIDFKLKVTEAQHQGLDTTQAFRKEYAGYIDQLAKPYLMDQKTLDHLVHEAYDHLRFEINASHILISCGMDVSAEDTLDAYNRIMQVRKKILEGTPFEQMARAVSDDPSAKSNGGNLGYFTALQMVYPFEKAAYALHPGDLSWPVRTRFGYHLIKVYDKRPNPGTVHVAHIMIALPSGSGPDKQKEAYEKINDIYRQLQEGASFDTLARRYSDDYNSARNGGVLPWFGTGKMVTPFEKAAFALENPGDISKPVQTSYGWHIIRLIEKKPLGSFDDLKESIRRKILSSDRAEVARDVLIKNLTSAYHIRVDSSILKEIASAVSVENNRLSISFEPSRNQKEIARGNNFLLKTADFLSELEKRQPHQDEAAYHFVTSSFHTFLGSRLLNFEKSQLARKNSEFKAVIQEYHDGMLLFEIMDRMVWSKATADSTALQAFYKTHLDRYRTEKKQIAVIYELHDPAIKKKLTRDIHRVNKHKLSNAQLTEKYHQRGIFLAVFSDTISYTDKKFGQHIPWKKGISGMLSLDGHYYIVHTTEIIPVKQQPLDEIRGIVTADFQDSLEKQWIDELRKKYSVKINNEVLESLREKIKS